MFYFLTQSLKTAKKKFPHFILDLKCFPNIILSLQALCNNIFNYFDSFSHRFLFQFESFPQLETNVHESKLSMERRVEEVEEQLRSRNRDFQRLQEKLVAECCICLATKPSIVFMPCRHLITCSGCYDASDFRECPTCRSTIENSITVFM